MFRIVRNDINSNRGHFKWIAVDDIGNCYVYADKPSLETFTWHSPFKRDSSKYITNVEFEGDWRESLMSLSDISIADYIKGEIK